MEEMLGGTRINYLGHSAFRLVTAGGEQILVDPFLSQNPTTPVSMRLRLLPGGRACSAGAGGSAQHQAAGRVTALPEPGGAAAAWRARIWRRRWWRQCTACQSTLSTLLYDDDERFTGAL